MSLESCERRLCELNHMVFGFVNEQLGLDSVWLKGPLKFYNAHILVCAFVCCFYLVFVVLEDFAKCAKNAVKAPQIAYDKP